MKPVAVPERVRRMDREAIEAGTPGIVLMERAAELTRKHFAREITFGSGSTDCNVPLSMGIPAICVGCYEGGGSHTREEYVTIDSLLPGLKFACDMILHHFCR